MSRKLIVGGARALVLLVLVLLALGGCKRKEEATPAAKEAKLQQWSQYVSEYTGGLVSKKAKLRVRFVNDVLPQEQVGQSAASRVTIEPKVPFEAMFESPREFVISPREKLASGQEYRIEVKADGLTGIPAELRTFEFKIAVIRQEFEILETGLSPAPSGDGSMVLRGTLDTADVEEPEAVEKVLTATFLGQTLPVAWQHNVDGRHHEFTVSGIQRQKEAASLQLTWDGKPMGVDLRGDRSVEVPPRDLFKVTGIRAVQGENRYVVVQFSDHVDPRQNLRGLVQLNSGRFTTRVEGNLIKLFPDNTPAGEVRVTVDGAVRSSGGQRLGEKAEASLTFSSEKPQVRFVGKGVILPENDRLTIPIEAVNVKSVQVTAFQVYEKNLGQFLQTNKLDGSTELTRVGRTLWRKTIPLSGVDLGKWNRYSLDASELLRAHPGSLFRLTLTLNRGNSVYACSEEAGQVPLPAEEPLSNDEDLKVNESSGWDFAEDYYGGQHASWADRRDPCKDAYYRFGEGVRDSRNFLASNLGLIAKQGSGDRVRVTTTDLKTGQPLAGVQVTLLNFQNRPIGKGTSDAQGLVTVAASGVPFYLFAEKEGQKGYLKLSAGNALPVSHFDVGGQKVDKGVKGTLYGERGVWRPGDDIFLTFVLQDREEAIPANHPVTLELYNPKGQLIQSVTNTTPVGDFYPFRLKTAETDLTGDWNAKARLGGMTFEKSLKIETVVPNRLKVELDFGGEVIYRSAKPLKATLFGQWLHGATASGLKADVSVRLAPRPTSFGRFTDYIFDDPAREFTGERQVVFEGKLDEQGYARFQPEILADKGAPGMLTAQFTSRIFEEGGAFSTSSQSFPFHPYENYLGIKLPKGDQTRGMILTDVKHKVEIASLSAKGEPVSLDKVQVTLYKIDWKWWWDKSGDSLARYASASHSNRLQQAVVSTREGQGSWELEVKYPDWGRYMIRACDLKGEHCTGQVFYMDWPGWAGRAQEEKGMGAAVLTLTTDKPLYSVGETATIHLPEAKQGRALVSIENGSTILEQRWLELSAGQSSFQLPVTRAMAPNVYVSVTLVQPHAGKQNDRPIRLYGVVPVKVEDPETRLEPWLKVADELRPESTAVIEVAEAKGRGMTYTLALVDEGLLGLTNFKTPDLHQAFYRKEALGVRTWDLFDEVVGAYGGELERILALGGDEEGDEDEKKESRRRFPPVVKFLGAFQLKAGETRRHEVKLPQYVGAVRVMLVAGEKGAYGKTEKSALVRAPLTLLSTLPRVLGPGEELQVPVSVFVMDPQIRDVELSVTTDGHFEVVGPDRVTVSFKGPGDELGFLRLKVKDALGKGSVRFRAVSGQHQAEQTVHIDVRSPNARAVRQQQGVVEPGSQWSTRLLPHGLPGTNRVRLEVSAVPPINLDHRLGYLIRYPHGCIEQTTSGAFPQIYLPAMVKLDKEARAETERNVQAGIERLRLFQRPDGAFAYWPGAGPAHPWATTYAGHFMVEAKRLGYQVPAQMLADWIDHQKSLAQSWVGGTDQSSLDQAYRLYTLALAGAPEVGAMNRLRESGSLSNIARWELAAAYRLVGQAGAAKELTSKADLSVAEYERSGDTFGSSLRDRSMLLIALVLQEEKAKAKEMADRISSELTADRWQSTQSVSFALMAMARFVEQSGSGENFKFAYGIGGGAPQEVTADKPIFSRELTGFPEAGAEVTLKNAGGRTLYVTLSSEGIPRAGEEEAARQGISVEVRFLDAKGNAIRPERLEQGADLVAEVKVRNLTDREFQNIALSQIVPSGWQIHNPRFEGEAPRAEIDYQDIRDDRLYTYFNLKARQEKSFTALFNASFLGRYYLPGWGAEAMYDATQNGRVKGGWVEVVKAGARE